MAWSSSPRPCGRNSWLSGRARPGRPRRAREPRLGRPPQSSVETTRETRETRRESGKREERLFDLDSAKKHGRFFLGGGVSEPRQNAEKEVLHVSKMALGLEGRRNGRKELLGRLGPRPSWQPAEGSRREVQALAQHQDCGAAPRVANLKNENLGDRSLRSSAFAAGVLAGGCCIVGAGGLDEQSSQSFQALELFARLGELCRRLAGPPSEQSAARELKTWCSHACVALAGGTGQVGSPSVVFMALRCPCFACRALDAWLRARRWQAPRADECVAHFCKRRCAPIISQVRSLFGATEHVTPSTEYLPVCLSVRPSVRRSVGRSVCLSVCVSVYLSIYLSLYLCDVCM